MHRYIREKIENKKDKKRERSKLNVILRHTIVNHTLMRSKKPYKDGKKTYDLEVAGEGVGKTCEKSGSKF